MSIMAAHWMTVNLLPFWPAAADKVVLITADPAFLSSTRLPYNNRASPTMYRLGRFEESTLWIFNRATVLGSYRQSPYTPIHLRGAGKTGNVLGRSPRSNIGILNRQKWTRRCRRPAFLYISKPWKGELT
jgi:hypothetical protein